MSRRSETASVALISATARVMTAALMAVVGFRAVSDDDFARVVIAQRFAQAPHLDPSATSWLPLPFWLVGAGMKLFGASLGVARVLAVVSAATAGAIVGAMAVAIGLSHRRAIAASLLAAAMPWAMQLSVATVPEVPAAACAAAGAMALASKSSRLRVLGAIALFASCLSRYDAWPIGVAFALFTLNDARSASRRDRAWHVLAAVVAVAGPVAWTAWQGIVYHDPFRYLGLVRSYRQALGGGPSLIRRILGYPIGAVTDMREVVAAGIVGVISLRIVRHRIVGHRIVGHRIVGHRIEHGRTEHGRTGNDGQNAFDVSWRRPLFLAALQLFVLILGDVRDGAPTHHPERALLGPATIVVFASVDAFGALLAGETSRRRNGLAALAATALVAWIGVRLYRSLDWYQAAPRPREVEAGRALDRATAKGSRVLIDTRDLGASPDYGYYAVLAAFGRPLDAEVDREQDPRKPRVRSSFETIDALRARSAATEAKVWLAWGSAHRRVAEALGAHVVAEEATAGTPAGPTPDVPASAAEDPADPSAQHWSVLALP